ncbi:MAG: FAD-dependent oxidoreductase [Panacagrimonas sp.]
MPAKSRVCIVGAGPAGITLACELDGCGFPVLLLEAGGIKHAPHGSEYYDGAVTAPHPAARDFRRVSFGGTSGIWGGRCVPFDPIDFEPRGYLPDSGWPIAYDEVARHYPRAMAYCDAGAADFSTSGSLATPGELIAGLDGGGVLNTGAIERYSLPTNFGTRYHAKIARSHNVTAVLNTRCLRLLRRPDGSGIASIEVVGPDGARHLVEADYFVLATGGIETPRLLLASDPAGIGNAHDLVGRYYACHFENTIGRLSARGQAVKFWFEKTRDEVYCRRKLLFTPEALRQHGLLNTAFRLHFPNYADARHGSAVMSAIFLAKAVLIAEYRTILQHNRQDGASSSIWAHLRNVIRHPVDLLRFGYDWLFKRVLATRKLPYTLVPNADGSYPLEFNCEQTPSRNNRVQLDPTARDAHGLPRVSIQWKIDEPDLERARRAFHLLRDTINRSGVATLEFDEAQLDSQLRSSLPLGGHLIGTTRMGASPETGVVDTNCALFEAPNCFVASSAVFPTSSHANPTLTIVAMAVRLAAHLKSL